MYFSYIYRNVWRRKWQPTPVFLPGKSHGWRRLVQDTVHGSQRVRHNWETSLSLSLYRNVSYSYIYLFNFTWYIFQSYVNVHCHQQFMSCSHWSASSPILGITWFPSPFPSSSPLPLSLVSLSSSLPSTKYTNWNKKRS